MKVIVTVEFEVEAVFQGGKTLPENKYVDSAFSVVQESLYERRKVQGILTDSPNSVVLRVRKIEAEPATEPAQAGDAPDNRTQGRG